MKVRIGLGLGINQILGDPEELGLVADLADELGIDSLWFSERVVGPALDPLAASGFTLGRTTRLKVGTSVLVLPGRNPILLAKHLASLDRISGGRFLPIVGLGTRNPQEHRAFGVDPNARSRQFDEAVASLRQAWGDVDGADESLDIHPKPSRPIPLWFGGRSHVELVRAGRFANGWLASFQTPAETADAVAKINKAAADAGRVIDADHFGTIVLYARNDRPSRAMSLLAATRPDIAVNILMPSGKTELETVIATYIQTGLSKFVLIPASRPDDWAHELEWLRRITEPLESTADITVSAPAGVDRRVNALGTD